LDQQQQRGSAMGVCDRQLVIAKTGKVVDILQFPLLTSARYNISRQVPTWKNSPSGPAGLLNAAQTAVGFWFAFLSTKLASF
jgi:hypothetical protein